MGVFVGGPVVGKLVGRPGILVDGEAVGGFVVGETVGGLVVGKTVGGLVVGTMDVGARVIEQVIVKSRNSANA